MESTEATVKSKKPRRVNRPPEIPAAEPEQSATIDTAGLGAAPAPAPVDDGGKRKSLSIPLRDDGTIDMDGMRESTRDKLTRALGNSPAIVGGGIAPEETKFLYDGLGSIQAWAGVRFFGVDPRLAEILQYTPGEKETLAEPTAKVLSKYLPSLGRWKDEATLVLALYSVMQNKAITLQAMSAKLLASQEADARAAAIGHTGPLAANGGAVTQ